MRAHTLTGWEYPTSPLVGEVVVRSTSGEGLSERHDGVAARSRPGDNVGRAWIEHRDPIAHHFAAPLIRRFAPPSPTRGEGNACGDHA